MSSLETERQRQEFQDKLRQIPPAQWVQDMIDHYHRTGPEEFWEKYDAGQFR